MAATLEETLAEAEALAQQEQEQATARARPAPRPKKPAPAPVPKKPPSALATIGQSLMPGPKGDRARGEVGLSVMAGILRSPGQLLGGSIDTSFDAGRFIGDSILPGMARKGPASGGAAVMRTQAEIMRKGAAVLEALPGVPGGAALGSVLRAGATTGEARAATPRGARPPQPSAARPLGASLADVLSARSTLGQVGVPAINQFTTEAIATTAPMALPGGGLVGGVVKAGVGGAVGMDAPDLQGRARNAALAGGLELGGALIVKGGSVLYRRWIAEGTPKEAAKDALDRAFAVARSEDARAATLAEQAAPDKPPVSAPQEELPVGTRVADAAPDPKVAPSEDAALIADANNALERSGAAERLPEGKPPELTPDGRIKVAPQTKAAADEAGFGRAFAAADESPPDAVIFREEAADGSSRVVGTMGREDLDAFIADVQRLRDNPASIDLPVGSPHGKWAMAHLGTTYDAPSVLRAIVNRIPASAKRLTTEEMAHQAQTFADVMGLTTDEGLAYVRGLAEDTGDIPTATLAAKTIWTRMGTDLDEFVMGRDLSRADDAFWEGVDLRINNLLKFSSTMDDVKYSAGRTLQVHSLPDADTFLAASRKARKEPGSVPPRPASDPPPLPRTTEEKEQWLQMWDALKGDLGKRAEFLAGIRTYPSGLRYLRESFPNFFTGAILSGPRTIILNVLNPAVVGGLRTLERTAGGAIMGINPMLRPAQREAARVAAIHAPVAYIQSLGDIATAFKYAAKTFDGEGVSALAGGGANPLESRSLFAMNVPEPVIRAAVADGKSAIPYHLGNMLNFLPRSVWRLHGTPNELALSVAYTGELRARAMLEATEMGLKGPDFGAFVSKRLSEGVDGPGGAALNEAVLDSANRTTMVRQPDPEFNPGYASFSRTINAWRQNVPELRYVLPIFQVPANGMGEALRRTPLGFLFKETQQELSGALGVFRQAEAHGRITLGAGLLVAGAMMARNGLITGGGPRDATDRRVWLMTHQPYSIRIGDNWVGYDRLDPIAPLLAIAAGYYDDSVYTDTDKDMTWAAVGALGQYFKDKAALQGIADLLNIGGDPSEQATFERRLGSIVGGFIPAFLKPAVSGIDPTLSVKTNPWDYIRANLPGLSLQLDPVRNILGEMVMKPQDTAVEALLPVSTQRINPQGADPVVDEFDRVYQLTGYTPGMLSPSPGSGAHFDLREIKLEDGYSLYNALMRGRLEVEVDGQTLREHLTELISSPEYRDAPDGTGRVDDADEGPKMDTKGGLLQQAFTKYNSAVEAEVARKSVIARKYLAIAAAKRNANDVLRPYSAEDLINDPSLMESLGIDLGRYEDAITGDDQ